MSDVGEKIVSRLKKHVEGQRYTEPGWYVTVWGDIGERAVGQWGKENLERYYRNQYKWSIYPFELLEESQPHTEPGWYVAYDKYHPESTCVDWWDAPQLTVHNKCLHEFSLSPVPAMTKEIGEPK